MLRKSTLALSLSSIREWETDRHWSYMHPPNNHKLWWMLWRKTGSQTGEGTDFLANEWSIRYQSQSHSHQPIRSLWAAPTGYLTWLNVQNHCFIISSLPLPWCARRMPSIWARPALSRTEEDRPHFLPGPSCWDEWDNDKRNQAPPQSFLKTISFLGLRDLVQSGLPNSRCTFIQVQRKWMLSKADYLTVWIICHSSLH